MPLDVSKYYLIRSSGGSSVMCLRGQDAPKIASGGARYNVVNRSRRRSTVQWDGDDPYRMDVPVLLDGWRARISVEYDVAKLNQMMQSQGDLIPPVSVAIDGAVPIKGAKWVIETIDWGDMVIWATDGRDKGFRLRQDAVIHLLQLVEPNLLKVKTPDGSTQTIVPVGKTMTQIARDWNTSVNSILKTNNMRDSKAIKPGMRLFIPANPFNLPIKITAADRTNANTQTLQAGPSANTQTIGPGHPKQLRGRG